MTDEADTGNLAPDHTPLAGDEPVREVERDGVQYTLLGTAHVSRTSARVVETMVRDGGFDAVAVELCESRYRAIVEPDQLMQLDLFEVVKSGRTGLVLANLVLGGYQKRLAEQLGVEPGAEMRTAVNAARAADTPLRLIDRDVGITLKRSYRKLGWWRRWKLMTGMSLSLFSRETITEEEIEELKQGDLMNNAFSEFAGQAPELYDSLISERDRYMAARLRAGARPGQRVLAVVGSGHLNGIAAELENATAPPPETTASLDRVPPPSRVTRAVPWLIVLLVVAGFVYGFWQSPSLGWAVVLDWVLIHGVLAALGAAVAAAHPLTVLTAFVAAPLTSLHPLIGAGMVTALAELYLRKPRVSDFDSLREDTASIRGWWRNRVSRVLLIFALSAIGSAIGTWVAGVRITARLF